MQPQTNAQDQMMKARSFIQNGQYAQAKAVLQTINHPKAREWLSKIEEIELGDPFKEQIINRNDRVSIVEQPKSYTNAAVIVLILYFVLWVPGFIANIMYLNEATKMEDSTGQSLPGVGALKMEAAIFLILPIIFILVMFIIIPLLTMNTSSIYQNIISGL